MTQVRRSLSAFFVTLITVFANSSFAVTLDLTKTQTDLNRVRTNGPSLAALVPTADSSQVPELSDRGLDPIVQSIFAAVQKHVFGRTNLLALGACRGCQATANAVSMTVFIDPELIDRLQTHFGPQSKLLITFLVAHEISHFTHEYATQRSSSRKTLNGTPSSMLGPLAVNFDISDFAKMTQAEIEAKTQELMQTALALHAEVDVFAYLTLKEMGIESAAAGIQLLEWTHGVPDAPPEMTAEKEYRIKTLKALQ